MLITTIVIFYLFYWSAKSQLVLEIKWLFKNQDLYMFGLKLNKFMSHFQPLEVVDRGSETQPQLVENLNKLT